MSRYRGKKQSMEKMIDVGTNNIAPGAAVILATLVAPEEIIIKRIIANSVPIDVSSGAAGAESLCFIASVTQADEGSGSLADALSPQRLVRSQAGSPGTGTNLDFVLTMRKRTGSSVQLIVENLSPTATVTFHGKLTIHYLEG